MVRDFEKLLFALDNFEKKIYCIKECTVKYTDSSFGSTAEMIKLIWSNYVRNTKNLFRTYPTKNIQETSQRCPTIAEFVGLLSLVVAVVVEVGGLKQR